MTRLHYFYSAPPFSLGYYYNQAYDDTIVGNESKKASASEGVYCRFFFFLSHECDGKEGRFLIDHQVIIISVVFVHSILGAFTGFSILR